MEETPQQNSIKRYITGFIISMIALVCIIFGGVALLALALIIILIGVIFIYDARKLTQKWFGFGDQNEATSGFKILGFIFAIIGAIIV